MLQWILNNIATITICIVLLLVVIGVIIHMLKEKRAGRSSCGCSCQNCLVAGNCHK